MSTLDSYYEALDRLIKNKPIRVLKDSAINKSTVAKEAGKDRGSIREKRPIFQKLIEAINEAQKTTTDSKKRSSTDLAAKLAEARTEIARIEEENNKLQSRYMSLLYLNLEMSRKMIKEGLDVPKLGGVVPINIEVVDKIEEESTAHNSS